MINFNLGYHNLMELKSFGRIEILVSKRSNVWPICCYTLIDKEINNPTVVRAVESSVMSVVSVE